MYNFTKERISACVQINRLARVCLEESIKYSMERKTFGKRLCDHPIIREKLSNMARQVEATHALIELYAN